MKTDIIERALTGRVAIPDWADFINNVRHRGLSSGAVGIEVTFLLFYVLSSRRSLTTAKRMRRAKTLSTFLRYGSRERERERLTFRDMIRDGELLTVVRVRVQLARVNSDQFGIAVQTVDGQIWTHGDADVPFTLQSCSKPITYVSPHSFVIRSSCRRSCSPHTIQLLHCRG
jgi:hypothetical protein